MGGLWRMGFRETVFLHLLLYQLGKNYTHECIILWELKLTSKKVGLGHGELSLYDKLYSSVLKHHSANSHCLTLLPSLTVVNYRLHNSEHLLRGWPHRGGMGVAHTWVEVGQTMRNILVRSHISNSSGLLLAHGPCTGNYKTCPGSW